MAAALAALLCTGRAAAQADAPLIQGESGGWRQGRATFYGGPERFLQNFPDRGPPPEYGFGDALFGSCGYTQQVGWLTAAIEKTQSARRGAAELLGERPASRVWPEIRPKYVVSAVQRSPSSTAFSIILICKLVPAELPSVPTNTTVLARV